MLALCANYEGTVPENQEAFDHYIETVHLPLVAKYPRLRALRYLKGVARDGVAPKYYLSFELFFDSLEDFQVAAKSEQRNRAVEDTKNFADQFKGEIHHVMYEVSDIPVASSSD
ncbi:MAG: EthD family reductase [Gammaproteobacteria bacterium]|nr:EthD family reductase [Gammaproteobacteria bacterium]